MSLYFYIIYAKYLVSDRFYDKRVVEVCDEKWCMVHKYEARNRWHNYRYPNTTFHEFHITIYRYSIAHLSSKYLKPIRNVQQTSYLLHPIVGYYLMDIFPIDPQIDHLLHHIIAGHNRTGRLDEAFYVVDVEDMIDKYQRLRKYLPRVQQHYAMKCNPSPIVLEVMVGLGISFDCAS
ncbi:unnamed protein product, partial [Oppiella nova]